MKKKTIYIILLIVLALGLIIYLITRIPKKEFEEFSFPPTIEVKNHTKTVMVDTITMVILNTMQTKKVRTNCLSSRLRQNLSEENQRLRISRL